MFAILSHICNEIFEVYCIYTIIYTRYAAPILVKFFYLLNYIFVNKYLFSDFRISLKCHCFFFFSGRNLKIVVRTNFNISSCMLAVVRLIRQLLPGRLETKEHLRQSDIFISNPKYVISIDQRHRVFSH